MPVLVQASAAVWFCAGRPARGAEPHFWSTSAWSVKPGLEENH